MIGLVEVGVTVQGSVTCRTLVKFGSESSLKGAIDPTIRSLSIE